MVTFACQSTACFLPKLQVTHRMRTVVLTDSCLDVSCAPPFGPTCQNILQEGSNHLSLTSPLHRIAIGCIQSVNTSIFIIIVRLALCREGALDRKGAWDKNPQNSVRVKTVGSGVSLGFYFLSSVPALVAAAAATPITKEQALIGRLLGPAL